MDWVLVFCILHSVSWYAVVVMKPVWKLYEHTQTLARTYTPSHVFKLFSKVKSSFCMYKGMEPWIYLWLPETNEECLIVICSWLKAEGDILKGQVKLWNNGITWNSISYKKRIHKEMRICHLRINWVMSLWSLRAIWKYEILLLETKLQYRLYFNFQTLEWLNIRTFW